MDNCEGDRPPICSKQPSFYNEGKWSLGGNRLVCKELSSEECNCGSQRDGLAACGAPGTSL